MLKLTRTGIGLLTRQYRSVLKKCFLIDAGLFFALAPTYVWAVDCSALSPSSSAADIAACVGVFSYNKATLGITDLAPSGNVNGWEGHKSKAIRNHINADQIGHALTHTTELAYHTISQDKSIIVNLEALDMLIGAYPSYNGMYSFENAPLLQKAKKDGWGVQSMDTGASILQNLVQLDFVVGGVKNGQYISNLNSMGDNIKALDNALYTNYYMKNNKKYKKLDIFRT